MKRSFSVLCLTVLLLSGCTALDMKNEQVSFEVPETVLKLRPLEPNAEELQGVMLRVSVPGTGELHALEHLKIYSRLRGDEGLGLDLRQNILITFKRVSGKDSYVQRTVSTFDKDAGKITEEIEISPRGEVVRFIEGKHESQAGKFQVLNLSRTPIYPEGPAKRGDSWSYEEKTEVRLDSFWVKEKNPEPYVMKAESTLAGFAEALGRRCAVIKTRSRQTKKVTLKVLFKTVIAEITAEIEETDYLDYARGILMAKVSQTRSHSIFQNLKMEDQGISQSIYQVTD